MSNVTGFGMGPKLVSPTPGPQSDSGFSPLTVIDGSAGFVPSDFYSFYSEAPQISVGVNGSGQSIGVVGVSDYLANAVTTFDTQFSLPATMITTVLVDGTNPGRDRGSNETEALLDLEWAHATATGASLRFYLAGASD